ncbi:uncharacterized protein [Ptychodera flava]|uniref:uncharacterized protein n=1 Tax=Ptychodera flava TaxID=63121 RepID=UPI00396AAB81
MTGPPLLNDVTSILLRFRANPIALTSDIEKAFLQIRLEPYERKFKKFLWLSDPNYIDSEFVTYQFKSVLFGAVCIPFILNAVFKTQMETDPENQTAPDLKQDIYVDDVISGCSTESEAVQYYEEANKLMDSSGFNLRSWSSNSDVVRKLTEKDDKLKSTPCVGTLGIMQWDSEKDTLMYKDINNMSPDLLTTKREVVSHTASLCDPLGLLSPVNIKAKLLIEDIWKSDIYWDEPLNETMSKAWYPIADDLNQSTRIKFNRRYFDGKTDNVDDNEESLRSRRLPQGKRQNSNCYG